jgi:NAD(P)-dependent dehydrogenase (short-subunit alcohol dehydrogenase family)
MVTGSLNNKGLIVVGADYGIGPDIVAAAAQQGARVVGQVEREVAKASEKLRGVTESTGDAEYISCISADLASEAEIETFLDTALDQLPALHALIYNQEIPFSSPGRPVAEISLADWNQELAIYLRKPFALFRRAVEEFLCGNEGGRLVYVAPVEQTNMGQAAYAAAQTALHAFRRSIVKEYGQRGVACNAVQLHSTLIAELAEAIVPVGDRRENLPQTLEMQERRQAVVRLVLFLASDAASYVNGEVFHVGDVCRH